ncbi:hypothetical protein BDR26DRAFT_860457 [Obelidium mucronatum]|nr:hypothetical protein BDR26DRAFT_860457 [Obelidium mucronatum]
MIIDPPDYEPPPYDSPSYEPGPSSGPSSAPVITPPTSKPTSAGNALTLSQIEGQSSIIVYRSGTVPIYAVNMTHTTTSNSWVNLSPAAIIANPPILNSFHNTAPRLSTLEFGSSNILNSMEAFCHNNTYFGFKIKQQGSDTSAPPQPPAPVINAIFPLDEENQTFAADTMKMHLLAFETATTKYQWAIPLIPPATSNKLLALMQPAAQNPLDPNEPMIRMRLFATPQLSGVKKFWNGYKEPRGPSHMVVLEFLVEKSASGVNGVLEAVSASSSFSTSGTASSFGDWSDQETALLVGSAVAAFHVFKYRLSRERKKEMMGIR